MKSLLNLVILVTTVGLSQFAYAGLQDQSGAQPANPPQDGTPSAPQEEPKFDMICAVAAKDIDTGALFKIDTTSVEGKEVVVVYLQDPTEVKGYLTVMPKGEFAKDLASGHVQQVLMGQNFKEENGVMKDAATLELRLNELNEMYEGQLVAKGNIYPIVCPLASMSDELKAQTEEGTAQSQTPDPSQNPLQSQPAEKLPNGDDETGA